VFIDGETVAGVGYPQRQELMELLGLEDGE